MAKYVRRRKGSIRLTSKGVRVTRPSYRIGGKRSWVNISSKGISQSVKTPLGTWNSKRGCSMSLMLVLALPMLLFLMANAHSQRQ